MGENANLPLAGVTVVEFCHSVAGPYAGSILADLGADVIKVESPDKGDYARDWGPPFAHGTSTLFHVLNHNKRGLALDLRDRITCERLIAFILDHADVVLQNMRPGAIDKLGPRRRRAAREEAVADLLRSRRLWAHRPVQGSPRLRSADAGARRHHEHHGRGRRRTGARRLFDRRPGRRHVGRDGHSGGAQPPPCDRRRLPCLDLAVRDRDRLDGRADRRLSVRRPDAPSDGIGRRRDRAASGLPDQRRLHHGGGRQ